MMRCLYILLLPLCATAQQNTSEINEGNKLYREGEYAKAEAQYGKALEKNKTDYKATYNQGNARYRQNNYTAAAETYTAAANNTTTGADKAKAFYNKGTALAKKEDLPGAIAAFKSALKLNPADEDCRFNLAKALAALKKQQDAAKQNQQPKPQPQQNKQPQPPKSNLNKQQLQQTLLAIRKKEKEVQNRLNSEKAPGVVGGEKDW